MGVKPGDFFLYMLPLTAFCDILHFYDSLQNRTKASAWDTMHLDAEFTNF